MLSTNSATEIIADLDKVTRLFAHERFLLTVTAWPAWRKETAAQRPAMPAPTTMIFRVIPLAHC